MANGWFVKGKEKFLRGEVSWSDHDIKVVFVDISLYTVDLANHEFLSSIPVGARVATSANLANKATAGAIAGADPTLVFPNVTGNEIGAFGIYRDTGSAATSPLLLWFDTVASGLPLTPIGTNVTITWDTDAAKKIAKL